MKPITKIIIFLVVAFIVVIIITAAARPAVAPATAGETPTPTTGTPTPSPSLATDPAYPLSEVAKHKTAADCWTAVGNFVYNLTPFVNKHPGGVENITKICGIDGTVAFTQMHGSSENAQKALATLKIGTLKK